MTKPAKVKIKKWKINKNKVTGLLWKSKKCIGLSGEIFDERKI